jgi:hypothetical protein
LTVARHSWSAASALGLAQALRKRQAACCCFSLGKCSITLRSL